MAGGASLGGQDSNIRVELGFETCDARLVGSDVLPKGARGGGRGSGIERILRAFRRDLCGPSGLIDRK